MKFKKLRIFDTVKKKLETVINPEEMRCDSELECARDCPYVGICDEGRNCPWDMNYD